MRLLLLLLFPFSLQAQVSLDSLPESQIDIPIQINLRPIYAMAENNVEKVFTSPNYPRDWVQTDCATRYKYHFRRSPLNMKMQGSTLDLSFTGFYQIIGATRACLNGVVLSPWSPSCRCGFDEPERKVQVGFTSQFRLAPNYFLQTKVTRHEPKPLDKCEVCFWGQDATQTVIDGLKAELDLSKKAIEDSFGNYNLRPYLQRAWNMLSDVYYLPGVGYFSLHPKRLRMNQFNAQNDLLHINIGLSATPQVSFARPENITTPLPDLGTVANPGGFNVFLEAALQYDSLSRILNGYLVGKRFDLTEGLFKKHIIINKTEVSGNENGDMNIMADFSGSFNGTILFTGKPVYNAENKSIEVKNLDYDLKTRNLFLKTAKWLFNGKIINEMKKYTSFELTSYYDTATVSLNDWLNREWTPGIKGTGEVEELKLTELYALPEHLLIRSNCRGKMSVMVSDIKL